MKPGRIAAFSLALSGVSDIPVHSGPDSLPRTVDDAARCAGYSLQGAAS
jgi:hypothetical protein